MSQKAYLPISAAKLYINNKEMEFSVLDTILPAGLNKTGLARFALINLNNRYADIAKQAGEMVLKYQIGTVEKTVMAGYIEEVKHQLGSNLIQIACTDYTGLLKTAITSEKIYRNQTDGVVVKDLVSSFASWCTTNNVQSSTDNIPYLKVEEGKDLLETLQEVAKRYSKVFFVDTAKDLHWIPKSTSGTPKATLEEGVNLLDAEVNREIGSIVNKFVLKCKIGQPADRDFWTESLTDWLCFDDGFSTTLYTNCDSYVKEDYPDSNFGTEDFLKVNSPSPSRYQTFVKIPLSSPVLEGKLWDSENLVLQLYNADSGIVVALHAVEDETWTETGITWNNKPVIGSKVGIWTMSSGEYKGPPSEDAKNYAQSRIDAGKTILNFCVKVDDETLTKYGRFESREYWQYRPAKFAFQKLWRPASSWGGSLETTRKVRGSYSLKFNSAVKRALYPKQRNLNLDPTKYTHFFVSLLSAAGTQTITLKLHKDASNYRSVTMNVEMGEFQEFDLTIADMTLTGTVDAINYVVFELPKTASILIDSMYFMAEVTIIKEDGTVDPPTGSQGKWGVKSGGETKGCMGSQSDAEAYAQRKLDALKEPPITIDVPLTPDLLDKFYMGDIVTAKIPSADINGNFMVTDPQHTFSTEGISFRCKLSEYKQELAEFLARAEADYLAWEEAD